MQIISFGYHHPIKTLWRQGKLSTVRYGLYGGELTQANISLEHLLPKCEGGKTFIDNLVLATKRNNNIRGNKPITDFITPEQAQKYLAQFKGIRLREFNGNKYIEAVKQTLKRLGIIIGEAV